MGQVGTVARMAGVIRGMLSVNSENSVFYMPYFPLNGGGGVDFEVAEPEKHKLFLIK